MSVLGNLCRLCLQSIANGVELFSTGEEDYSRKLEEVFRIQLDEVAQYPTMACTDCIRILDEAKGLRDKILLTERQLLEKISIVKVECNPLDSFFPTIEAKAIIEELPLSMDVFVDVEVEPAEDPLPENDNPRRPVRQRAPPKLLQIEDKRKTKAQIREEQQLRSIELNERRAAMREKEIAEREILKKEKAIEQVKVRKEKEKLHREKKKLQPAKGKKISLQKIREREEMLKRIPRDPLEDLMYKMNLLHCHYCKVETENLNVLRFHMNKAHNRPAASIFCCERLFIGRPIAMDHMRFHLVPDTFKCDLCGKAKKSGRALEIHKKNAHVEPEEAKFFCEHCGKGFLVEALLQVHLKGHLPPESREYKCDQCDKAFNSEFNLTNHKQSVHEKRKTAFCEVCGKGYPSKYSLSTHMKSHEEATSKQCKFCGKYFISLRNHIRQMHRPQEMVNCKVCGKQMKKRNLPSHMIYHKAERKACDICGKTMHAESIKDHMDIHLGVRKKCLFCPAQPTNAGNLSKHMRENHPEEYEQHKASRFSEPITKNVKNIAESVASSSARGSCEKKDDDPSNQME